MTSTELKPYFQFYENLLKPLFHNFKSLYKLNMKLQGTEYWKHYTNVN